MTNARTRHLMNGRRRSSRATIIRGLEMYQLRIDAILGELNDMLATIPMDSDSRYKVLEAVDRWQEQRSNVTDKIKWYQEDDES